MEFKANRLYYFISKKYRKGFLAALLGAVPLALFCFFIYDYDTYFFIWPILVSIIYSVSNVFSKPKKFEICESYVSLKLRIKIPTDGYKNKYYYKRVNAKILDIDAIQYHSSPFEESNRVGRIIIRGRVVARDFCEDYVEAEHLPSYVEIYGVKDFESAVSALKTTFPDAILQEL